MQKQTTIKFIEGAVAGLALGVAASVFLSSKTGKALQEDAKDMMADFYKYIAPKVKKIGKMGEEEYKKFMRDAAEQYGKLKKMSEDKVTDLIEQAQQSWESFTKESQ